MDLHLSSIEIIVFIAWILIATVWHNCVFLL